MIHIVAGLWTRLLGPITVSAPPVASTSEQLGEKSTQAEKVFLSGLISSSVVFVVEFSCVGLSDHRYWRGKSSSDRQARLFEPFEGNQVREGVFFVEK